MPCLLSCRAVGCQRTPSSAPPNPAPFRVKLRNNETEPIRRTSRRGKRNKFYLRPKHLARKTKKEREQGSGEKKKDIKKERQRKHSNPFPFRNCQVTLTEVTEYPQKPSLLHQHGPYGVDGAGCGVRSSAWDPSQSLGPEAPGETAYCGRGRRESPHASNTAQWARTGGTRYRGPPRQLSFLLVKHTLMDRAARCMQLGVGHRRAVGFEGTVDVGTWEGSRSGRCRDNGTHTHTQALLHA